ncbi:hypothetical protein [Methyloglobulus sp.]
MSNNTVGLIIRKHVMPAGSGYPAPWMASYNPSMESGFRQSMPE